MKLHHLPLAKPVFEIENEDSVLDCSTSVSPSLSPSPSPVPSDDINLGMSSFGPPLVRVC